MVENKKIFHSYAHKGIKIPQLNIALPIICTYMSLICFIFRSGHLSWTLKFDFLLQFSCSMRIIYDYRNAL